MGRKSKKSRAKKNNKNTFRDARMAFHSGNIELAKKRLKLAQIKPQEEQAAAQLTQEIVQQEIIETFEQHNYEKILTLQEDDFVASALKSQELLEDKVQVATGIANLYLGDFELAVQQLAITTQAEYLQKFAFYYLLACLYQKDIPAYTPFEQQYAYLYEGISDQRKLYLKVAFHLRNGSFEEAQTLLESLEHDSRSNLLNITALQDILKNQMPTELNSKVKPFYKLLLEGLLSPQEQAYLTYFEDLKEQVNRNNELQLQTRTDQDFEEVFEESFLSPKEFETLIAQMQEAERPFLAYNQAAQLYNAGKYADAQKVMVKYDQYFFQIPEALLLYVANSNENENVQSRNIFRFVKAKLERHKDQYNALQIDSVGWLLYQTLLVSDSSDRIGLDNECKNLLKAIPNIVALQLWQTCRYALTEEKRGLLRRNQLPKQAQDIFASPNIKENKDALLRELDIFLKEFVQDDNDHPLAFLLALNSRVMLSVLNKTIQVFNAATASENFNPKAKVALDVYKMLNKYLGKAAGVLDPSEVKVLYEKIEPVYETLLHRFKEYYPESPYYQDFKAIELAPKLLVLEELLEDDEVGEFIEELQLLKEEGQLTFGFSVLLDYIDKENYQEEDAYIFAYTLLHLDQVDDENVRSNLNVLLEGYDERAAISTSSYPHIFHGYVLAEMMESKSVVHYKTIQIYLKHYVDDMVRFQEPVIYNNIAAFLEHVVRLDKKKLIKPDQELLQKLITYIGKVAKSRRLKGLTSKHKKINTYFKKLQSATA